MVLIVEIRLEKLSSSVDIVESNSIPKEDFEGNFFFESNECTCIHEGDEALSLNDLKVDSNIESFR